MRPQFLRGFAALFVLLTLLGASAAVAAAPPPSGESTRIIVRFQPGTSPEASARLHMELGARLIKRIPGLQMEVVQAPVQRLAAYRQDRQVRFAEVDQLVAPDWTPNDPALSSQWHHTRIESAAAWDNRAMGEGVLIGICDTGVDPTHPDLLGNIRSDLGWNIVEANTNWADYYGHGTATAGTAAAAANNLVGGAGTAHRASIIPIRITDDPEGYAYVSDAVTCIQYAVNNGARVVNLSYRMAYSDAIDAAASDAAANGAVTVLSAGNSGDDPAYPDWPNFLAVSATDANDALATFSSFGNHVDLAAPGVNIYTTANGGGYAYKSGTSFAAPMTAGVLAQMFSVYPALTAAQAQEILLTSVDDLGTPGEDIYFGAGRLNARKAIEQTQQYNQVPTLTVTSPAPGAIFKTGSPVTFTATAGDAQDGDLTPGITWLSSWNGILGTGSPLTRSDLATGTHTIIATVSDAAGAQYEERFTIEVWDDQIPPTGTVSINGGATYAGSTAVSLSLSATDEGSRLTDMRFSDDGTTWTDWEPYKTTRPYTLPAGDGIRTVFAQFRDLLGNESAPASDSIELETVSPTGSVVINDGASYTGDTIVTLTLTAQDDRAGVTEMRVGSGSSTPSWQAWEPFAPSRAFTLSRVEGNQTVWAQFRDAVGNLSTTCSDTIYMDILGPNGTISINNGASYANSLQLTLTLNAWDYSSGSGVAGMRFSEDGTVWTDWQPYAAQASFTLSPGEGVRRVYVQYKDGVGFLSGSLSDTIEIDTLPPVISSVTVANGATVSKTNYVSVNTAATDSGSGLANRRLSSDGINWSAWEYYTYTMYTLSPGDGLRTVYVQLQDRSGNISEAGSDTILIDSTGPAVTSTSLPDGAVVTSLPSFTWYMTDMTGVDEAAAYTIITHSNGGMLNSGINYTRDNSVDGQITVNLIAPTDDTYTFELAPYDDLGNAAPRTYVKVTLDTKGPSVTGSTPSNNSTVASLSTLVINLGADPAGVDEAGTLITATRDGLPFTEFLRDDSVEARITVTIPTAADGKYVFTVTPGDMLGNTGATATVTITDIPEGLLAPTSLTATVSGTTVSLAWVDQATNETGFVLERALKPKSGTPVFQAIATVPAANTAGTGATIRYTDSGRSSGTWIYRVKAINATQESSYSAEVQARVR